MIDVRVEGNEARYREMSVWISRNILAPLEFLSDDIALSRRSISEWLSGETSDAIVEVLYSAAVSVEEYVEYVQSVVRGLDSRADVIREVKFEVSRLISEALLGGLQCSQHYIQKPSHNAEDLERYRYQSLLYGDLSQWMQRVREKEERSREDLRAALTPSPGLSFGALERGAVVAMAGGDGWRQRRVVISKRQFAQRLDGMAMEIARRGAGKSPTAASYDADQLVVLRKGARAQRAMASSYQGTFPPFKVAGGVLAVGGIAVGTYQDIQDGETAAQAVASNVVAGGASFLASAGAGAAVGAAVGSAFPGLGTIVGAVAGIVVGGVTYFVTDYVVDSGWEYVFDENFVEN